MRVQPLLQLAERTERVHPINGMSEVVVAVFHLDQTLRLVFLLLQLRPILLEEREHVEQQHVRVYQ